ncbi:MAG: sel1 repeat family protein [Sterolibacteriaceae bacterium]|nr:sel1 repeat family protein [Sterolibacteriaceae bacterium]
MNFRLLPLLALILSGPTFAADGAAFRDAAKLHRAGDTAAAIAIWQPLAQKGDANAAFNLGAIHQHGDGVAKDPVQALKWYRIAAERGDRESQSRLGAMYLAGEGTAKNEKEGWRRINEHRVAHLHHDHHPHMQAWREQAAKRIDDRDRREAFAASRSDSARVMAELKRRAGAPEAIRLASSREAPAGN